MLITHPLRLLPGADLKAELAAFLTSRRIEAGWIGCCVGSLTQYHIRFANAATGSRGSGYFEIVSLTGTVSVNGCHLHISISDSAGCTTGGHLLEDNIIYTTAEIVILETKAYSFTREHEGSTPWPELVIRHQGE